MLESKRFDNLIISNHLFRIHAEIAFMLRLSNKCSSHSQHEKELKGCLPRSKKHLILFLKVLLVGFPYLHTRLEIIFAFMDSDGSYILRSVS